MSDAELYTRWRNMLIQLRLHLFKIGCLLHIVVIINSYNLLPVYFPCSLFFGSFDGTAVPRRGLRRRRSGINCISTPPPAQSRLLRRHSLDSSDGTVSTPPTAQSSGHWGIKLEEDCAVGGVEYSTPPTAQSRLLQRHSLDSSDGTVSTPPTAQSRLLRRHSLLDTEELN